MSEYIFHPENDSNSLTSGIEDMCALLPKEWYGTLHEEIVRCKDCKWLYVYMGKSYCDCDYMKEVGLEDYCSGGEKKGSLENGIR